MLMTAHQRVIPNNIRIAPLAIRRDGIHCSIKLQLAGGADRLSPLNGPLATEHNINRYTSASS